VFEWIKPHLRADQVEPLRQLLDRARVDAQVAPSPSTISELQPADRSKQPDAPKEAVDAEAETGGRSRMGLLVIVAFVALLLSAGYLRGRQVTSRGRSV
jgi:cobaltochelatase CobN